MSRNKAAWEEKAATWASQADDPANKFSRLTHCVAEFVGRQRRCGKALDVGCGPGHLCEHLLELGYDTYAIDISEAMIRAAVARLSGRVNDAELRFRVCGEADVPFSGAPFDLITAIQVFSYVADQEAYIARLASALRPGGLIVASGTNRLSLAIVLEVALALLRFRPQPIWNLVRTGYHSGGYVDYRTARQVYNAAAFDRMFLRQGFRVVDSMDWFHLRRLDKNPLNRRGIGKCLARRLAWYHVGAYEKPRLSGEARVPCSETGGPRA